MLSYLMLNSMRGHFNWGLRLRAKFKYKILYVKYTCQILSNTHVKFCKLDIIYYMIYMLIFNT